MNPGRKHSILLGAAIRERPPILEEHLKALEELRLSPGTTLSALFIDSNDDPRSSALLARWCGKGPWPARIVRMPAADGLHGGGESAYRRRGSAKSLTEYKNLIIKIFLMESHTHLFLVDSDVAPHPDVLERLIGDGVDIVAAVYWTAWRSGLPELPNVWLVDEYGMGRGRSLAEQQEDSARFLGALRTPALTSVGGLGGCTLLRRRALERGLTFAPIPNLSFKGEERHFCVRARALGFDLWADSHLPVRHLSHEEVRGDAQETEPAAPGTQPRVMAEEEIAGLIEERRYGEALEPATRALGARGPVPSLMEMAGDCCAALGDSSRAEEYYRMVIEVLPDSPAAYLKLAHLYIRTGELNKATGLMDLAHGRGIPGIRVQKTS